MDADVAVIGAGTAGATVALQCARQGLQVLCLDRRDLEEAGARWANNIPAWMFDAADVARPQPPEKLGDPTPIHLFAGYGPERIVVENHGCIEVDMRRLVDRLREDATDAGARFVGGVTVRDFDGEVLSTTKGRFRARWYVDASGLGGAGLVDLPSPRRSDICTAAQQVHQITDVGRARRFFADHDVPYGHTLCYGALHGGYSVIHLRAHHSGRIHILTGSIPGRGNPSGRHILSDFVRTHSDWVGECEYGGASPIPLGRPVDRLARGRVAVVGDAAVQVLSAHGSGVGAGMMAAKILADSLADGEGVEGYARRWQRRYGGMFAAYDLFRRFTCGLDTDEMAAMMRSGLLHPHLASLSLRQVAPVPRRLILPRPTEMVKKPQLLMRLGSTLARMAWVALLYRRYPDEPKRVADWANRVQHIFSEASSDLPVSQPETSPS